MSAPERDHVRLAALAERAGTELADAEPLTILRWAADEFGDTLAVACSMADAVLPHLAGLARPGVPVLFLDTGYHFAETIGTRDAVAATLPVTVVSVTPERTVAEQDAEFGPRLYARDPDRCCAMRKVAPLARSLVPYHAWVTGIRRDDAPTRTEIRVVEWDAGRAMVKVNPLANWTISDLEAYIERNGVLVNPLVAEGYPSIGCAPCTAKVAPGADPRSGRWAGMAKTECGLHT